VAVQDSDGEYRWIDELGPRDSLDKPPQWLAELCPLRTPRAKPSQQQQSDDGDKIAVGERNSVLAHWAGKLRRIGLSTAEIRAALEIRNQQRCTEPLDRKTWQSIAWSVGRYEPEQAAVADAEGWVERYLKHDETEECDMVAIDQNEVDWLWNRRFPARHAFDDCRRPWQRKEHAGL